MLSHWVESGLEGQQHREIPRHRDDETRWWDASYRREAMTAVVRGGGFTKCRATEPFRGSCRADMAQMALVALRRNNRAGQLGRCCISRMGEEVHERQAMLMLSA